MVEMSDEDLFSVAGGPSAEVLIPDLMGELDNRYPEQPTEEVPVVSETFKDIFAKQGIPKELRTPDDYFFEKHVDEDGYDEWFAIPREIYYGPCVPSETEEGKFVWPESHASTLTESGAVISHEALVDRPENVGPGAIVGAGSYMLNYDSVVGARSQVYDSRIRSSVSIGEETIIESSLIDDNAQIGNNVIIQGSDLLGGVGVTVGSRAVVDMSELKDGSSVGFDSRVLYSFLGNRAIVDPNCIVEKGSRINDRAKLGLGSTMTGATIGMDSIIGDSAKLGKGAKISQNVTAKTGLVLETGAYIEGDVVLGAGVVIKESARISEGAEIGNKVTVGENSEVGVGLKSNWSNRFFSHKRKTKLESDVELGRETLVNSGITVGKHSRTAVGSRIEKNLKPWTAINEPRFKHAKPSKY